MARPRKSGHRFPCGKRRPTVVAQLEQVERDRMLAPMAVVLAQPHRLGNTDQRCSSALGRFCMAFRVPTDVMCAADEYDGLVRRWRAAWSVPTPIRLSSPGSTGHGPELETVRRWGRSIEAVRAGLERSGIGARVAVDRLILDDRDPAPGSEGLILVGLWALAAELGWVPANRHPYRAAA